jgi:hypothetical protein
LTFGVKQRISHPSKTPGGPAQALTGISVTCRFIAAGDFDDLPHISAPDKRIALMLRPSFPALELERVKRRFSNALG